MFDIIETYQEEESLKNKGTNGTCFATVKSISSNGMTVQFDGETATSTKAYPFNISGNFRVNDKVLMIKINGEYIAIAPIGRTQR